ncbi:methionyl-tRNA formyltransferase [Lachnospiraceae bacterium 45-P1]
MKNIVIGAVNSTRFLLETMMQLNIDVSYVFSLDDAVSENVSGYYPLHEFAEKHGIPFKKYQKINQAENIEIMRSVKPDFIFAIGFSQLVSKEILDIPKHGVIGLHPADLPKYRGRAVIVWQMLTGVKTSKVTLFKIDEGADTGDIIDQEPFEIGEDDYSDNVLNKLHEALLKLYKRALPDLMDGTYALTKQDHSKATYCLRRAPEDGQIDWNLPGKDLVRFIRAVSRPYPGAFSYYDHEYKIIIWRAKIEENTKYYGFPGQIAELSDEQMIIVLKDGLLVVEDYENVDDKKMFVGHRFGDKK